MVRSIWFLGMLCIGMTSCNSSERSNSTSGLKEIESFISLFDNDLMELEEEIVKLTGQAESLYEDAEILIDKADKEKFLFRGNLANVAPNANQNFSTLFISTLAKDKQKVMDLIYLTESLDSSFKSIVERHDVVSQVYFNSPLQLNRLYPPFDAATMLDHDIDLTAFNFYYEADEKNNVKRGPVWINEIYIDPVGRGWMISLLHPVYHNDELKMVLGFDITVNDILVFYLDRYSKNIVIIDEAGTVVAGKAKAIEALSLPPLTNHTYIQTINSNSYRMEDFNLFKSKSKEVRKMASHFLLVREKGFILEEGFGKMTVTADKMERLNWYVLDITFE